jgi:type VI secretion system secreted protein Hcp
MKARVLAALAAVLIAGPPEARATNFAILLGPSIQGESLNSAFPGAIDVESLSLNGPIGSGTSGSLMMHKKYDKASPKLLEACASGRFIRAARLFGQVPGSPPQLYLDIELRDVRVTSINQEKSELGVAGRESVELQFAAAHFTYYESSGNANTAYLPPAGGPDSDGDGIPDVIEIHYRLNPSVKDADQDSDGDGLENLREIQLGFNPSASDSFFRAEVAAVPGNPNVVDVSWECVPGKPYVIEWSPDLVTGFGFLANHTPDGTRATVRLTKVGLRGFFKVRPQ